MATAEPANEMVMKEGVKEQKREKSNDDGKAKPQEQCRADFLSSRHHFLFRQSAPWESVNEQRGKALNTRVRTSRTLRRIKWFSHHEGIN